MVDPDDLIGKLEAAFGRPLTARTVGELTDEIAARLGTGEVRGSLRETALGILTRALSDVSGRVGVEVTEETRIAQLMPPMSRRLLWKQLGEALRTELPGLERPWQVVLLVFLAGLGLVIAALVAGQGFFKSISAGIGTWGALGLISRPVRLAIPTETSTVGKLADHLVLTNPRLLKPEGAPWSRAQILEVVLAAVKTTHPHEEVGEKTPLDPSAPDSAHLGV